MFSLIHVKSLKMTVSPSEFSKQRLSGLPNRTEPKQKISPRDRSTPCIWARCLFPCTHPIWGRWAPAARWQLTIASLPLINSWNNPSSHKQWLLNLWAKEFLSSAIVGAKYGNFISSSSLCSSLKAGWGNGGLLGGTEWGWDVSGM